MRVATVVEGRAEVGDGRGSVGRRQHRKIWIYRVMGLDPLLLWARFDKICGALFPANI